ncbi:hypothetical protein CIC12_32115 [Burkholderia sp. SG-MS1]|nr:hypothetical protein [Paraburkholderia sp. SG-MS1]
MLAIPSINLFVSLIFRVIWLNIDGGSALTMSGFRPVPVLLVAICCSPGGYGRAPVCLTAAGFHRRPLSSCGLQWAVPRIRLPAGAKARKLGLQSGRT